VGITHAILKELLPVNWHYFAGSTLRII
jgi:hypothetical protein